MPLPPYADVLKECERLGFAQVGILTLPEGILAESGEKLRDWLALGYQADMQWMVTHLDKRLDPLSLMPGTQSILCVAMNYYTGPLSRTAQAKIARYAQGDDYHGVVKDRLKKLLAWLKTFDAGIEGRPLTDSAPILEKALAVKAGLGWQGKNSNLITRTHGSWVFLGELLLNITFPDAPQPEPMADFCGSCRRCITACPTQAIVDPAVVDANKCISYWTIESKADTMPDEIAGNLNGWLFGCDICQDVCPWNIKFAQETPEAAFLPLPWNAQPNLPEIIGMAETQFKIRYRKSPVKRAKLKGLQRNARVLTYYSCL